MEAMKNAYIKSQVQSWDPIIGKVCEGTSFTAKFETILKHKVVLNQWDIDFFKKTVDGKREGVWMQDLPKLYSSKNHMSLLPQLDKYGILGANVAHAVSSLTPLVFHRFIPSDESYDCLLVASNLEQPLWIFSSHILRKFALTQYCRDLLQNLKTLSCKYFHKWTTIESIGAYKNERFEFTPKFILALLYHYDMVKVDIFLGVHCLCFINKVEDTWSPILDKARNKNIVDSLYTFNLIGNESNIILDRKYEVNRSDLSRFIPYPDTKLHEVIVTEVVSPLTLSVFPSDQMHAIESNQEKMCAFYSSHLPILQIQEEDIQPFTQCVVEDNDRYYRAMVARVVHNEVTVELTDYNWIKTVPKSSLKYLHSDFAQTHTQGFTFKLAHISHLIATKETIVDWLKKLLFVKSGMRGLMIESCELDGTRRVLWGLMKVRRTESEWVYIHELMAEKGLVLIDDRNCLFHERGII